MLNKENFKFLLRNCQILQTQITAYVFMLQGASFALSFVFNFEYLIFQLMLLLLHRSQFQCKSALYFQ